MGQMSMANSILATNSYQSIYQGRVTRIIRSYNGLASTRRQAHFRADANAWIEPLGTDLGETKIKINGQLISKNELENVFCNVGRLV